MKQQSISKEQVGVIQLRDALKLYYAKSYISSITLAGAAEEILGKLSNERITAQLGVPCKNSYADDTAFLLSRTIVNSIDELRNIDEDQKEQYYSIFEKDFFSKKNKIRNQLKHKDDGENEILYENFKVTAETHLSGAIINYAMFKNSLPRNEVLIMRYCSERGINYTKNENH